MRISDWSSDVCSSDLDSDAVPGGPFGVLVLAEAAIDEMALRPAAIALPEPVEHRPDEPAVRAGRHGRDVDHDLAARHRADLAVVGRSEEHTSELQSLMRISYAVFCLKKKKNTNIQKHKCR